MYSRAYHLCRKQRMLIYLTVRFFGFFFLSHIKIVNGSAMSNDLC